MDIDFAFDEELLPVNKQENLGTSDLTFDGLLPTPLKVYEDGGASGCGGKLWPAGELLSRYLIREGTKNAKNIIELGSGTGLVGLAIGIKEQRDDLNVWVTDIDILVPLMEQNIKLNGLGNVHAEKLMWGEPLPEFAKNPDLILAADCVYLESAFPLLEQTLLNLTENGAPVLICYKLRRSADKRFFKKIRKHFNIEEIKDHKDYELFFPQAVYLYKAMRKNTNTRVVNIN